VSFKLAGQEGEDFVDDEKTVGELMDEVVGEGARRALHDRGGAVCRILRSGRIAVGDAVEGVPGG